MGEFSGRHSSVVTVVTSPDTTTTTMITISLVLLLAVSSMSAPSPQLPPGIDAATCPNYPFCGAGPAQASPQDAGLAAHAAAEAAVKAQQAQFPAGASGIV